MSHGNIFANIICAFSIQRLDTVICTLPLTDPSGFPSVSRLLSSLHSRLWRRRRPSVGRALFFATIFGRQSNQIVTKRRLEVSSIGKNNVRL
ncbi:MAG: hypothetical protein DME96_06120 [Verrucomicrobia bacterium]|nr:MAG: hypothetical protein DME96_06120 [Verrucomicrobiota bacterium]